MSDPKQLTQEQANRWTAILLIVVRFFNAALAKLAPTFRLIPETGDHSLIIQPTSAAALSQDKLKSNEIIKRAGYRIVLPPTLLDDPGKLPTRTRSERRQVTVDVTTAITDNVAAATLILSVLCDLFSVYNRGSEKLAETLAEIQAHLGIQRIGDGKGSRLMLTKACILALTQATADLGRWPVGAITIKATKQQDGNRHGVLVTCKFGCTEKPAKGATRPWSLCRAREDKAVEICKRMTCLLCEKPDSLTFDGMKATAQRKRSKKTVTVNA